MTTALKELMLQVSLKILVGGSAQFLLKSVEELQCYAPKQKPPEVFFFRQLVDFSALPPELAHKKQWDFYVQQVSMSKSFQCELRPGPNAGSANLH